MFEETLIESQVMHGTAARRWTMAGSTALQAAAAAVLIAIPLLHPERLTFHPNAPLVFTPPPPRLPVPQAHVDHAAQGATTASLPIAIQTHLPILIQDPAPASELTPVIGPITTMESTVGIPDVLTRDGHGVNVSVASTQAPATPRRVSQGMLAGMLLSPIHPIYPPIAKAAGVSGTVVVEAIISKTGTIESLHVASSPEMLRVAALDAIRAARYQPYRLNGEPIEIQTTITVNFRMGT
jgi:protein TonB